MSHDSCTHAHAYKYTHIHTYKHTNAHTHTHTHIHTQTHTHKIGQLYEQGILETISFLSDLPALERSLASAFYQVITSPPPNRTHSLLAHLHIDSLTCLVGLSTLKCSILESIYPTPQKSTHPLLFYLNVEFLYVLDLEFVMYLVRFAAHTHSHKREPILFLSILI